MAAKSRVAGSVDGEFTVKTYRTGMKAGKDGRKHCDNARIGA